MILVTGATGRVGRPLVDQLLREFGAEVRVVTRNPATADLPRGVDVVGGDPTRPYTMSSAMSTVTAVYFNPAAIGDSAEALVTLARENGVRRVVAQAAINVDDDDDFQPSRFRGDRNKEAEQAAMSSGMEWVSLRPTSFSTNAIQSWAAQISSADVVRGPFAAFQEAPIDPRDIAEVAAIALVDDRLVGQRLEITGPESLSHTEMVEIIGKAIGRPLRFQEIPAELAEQAMTANGLPQPFVKALMARYRRDVGKPAKVTHELEPILGRPPTTFEQWAIDHASVFKKDGAHR